MPRRINKEQARAHKRMWSDELAASPEYQILDALVKQTIDAGNAVQKINDRITEAAITQPELTEQEKKYYPVPSKVGEVCYMFAGCVLECAQRTAPEHQTPLVVLIARLQEIQMTDQTTEELLKVDGELVWKALPTFGYSFADELGSVNPQHVDMTVEERNRWENLTCFCAKLSMRSDFNLMSWASIALHYAFGPWDRGFKPQSTHYAVRAASLWYVHAADKIWELIMDRDKLWEHYTREEWKRWKNCFNESQEVAADEDTKKLIEEALSQIDRVESSGK